jgi:hypothetical protein
MIADEPRAVLKAEAYPNRTNLLQQIPAMKVCVEKDLTSRSLAQDRAFAASALILKVEEIVVCEMANEEATTYYYWRP